MLYSRTVSTVALVLLATGCSGRQVDLSSPDVLVKCRGDVDCPAGKSCGEGAVCQLVEGADDGAGGQEAPSGEGEGEGPSGAGKGEGEGEPTGGSPAGEGEAAAPGEGEGEAPGEPPGEGEGEGEAPGSGEGEGEGEVDPPRPIVAGCGALAFADVGDGVLTEALAPTALDDAVTWETWFKLDAGVDRPDDSPLVLLRNGCDGAQLSLQGAEGGHVVAWRRGLAACEGRTPVAPGRWHHVAAVHGEGPGALLTLFLNGMPECFGEGGDGDPEAPDGPPGADLGRSLIVGAGGPGCPDLGQSVLQLEFDDRQLADSSPSRHPVAPIGDADAVPEFGGVLDLPAAEDHLEVSRGDDFAFGEESFTVE